GAGGTAGSGVSAGMPAAGGAGSSMTGQPPATGQPGTQAPASAAPVGSASSDYMSHEGANGAEHSSISGPSAKNSETHARRLETKVERDIAAARADGVNVAKAQHQKWLGSTALSKGDRAGAMHHFKLAERDLRAEGYRMSRNNVQYNDTRTNLNANETSQTPNAANMHSNRGTNAAY
ncbi:MAG TPA: hypothetical protein VJ728_01780, partial [Candidatus Binataceae bacterium]|nr:hypothetical protein [Candidatus Binataceae bacterium]